MGSLLISNLAIMKDTQQIKNDEIRRQMMDIFSKNRKKYLQFATRVVKDPEIAEDIMQDTFYNIFKKERNFTMIKNPDHYFFRSVKFACYHFFKFEFKNQTNIFKIHDFDEFGINIYTEPCYNLVKASEIDKQNQELASKIIKAVESLPTARREVMELILFLNVKLAKTSQILGVHRETVKTHRRLGLIDLRRKLKSEINKL